MAGKTIREYFIPEIGKVYAKQTLNDKEKSVFGKFYGISEKLDVLVDNCDSREELENSLINYLQNKATSFANISNKIKEKGLNYYLVQYQNLQSKMEVGK